MAEEELEGLDDLDGLMDDAGGGESDGFAGELDDFLSDEDGEAGGGDEGAAEGGGDSELDSFFEDLSTIDDLEVIQDEEPADEPDEAPAEEPMMEEEDEEVAAAPEKAKPAKKKKEKKPASRKRKLIMYLIFLSIFAGGGYFTYLFFFPDMEPPWPTLEQVKSLAPEIKKEEPAPPPEPPPAPVVAVPAKPPPPAEPPPGEPAYRVQVATCFFNSCVDGFKVLLKRNHRPVSIRTKTTENESLEILSKSVFTSRQTAEDFVTRINREHRLEGQAFLVTAAKTYLISMGTFPDLSRANVVRDDLNQRYAGEVIFTTRLKRVPYKLTRILTGRYAQRKDALRELTRLRKLDHRFKGAFLVHL